MRAPVSLVKLTLETGLAAMVVVLVAQGVGSSSQVNVTVFQSSHTSSVRSRSVPDSAYVARERL